MKKLLGRLHDRLDKKFVEQFGFCMNDVTFSKIVNYLHAPKDPSSLAVTRILFGLAMLFDIPDERGGSSMVKRWGDPKTCHFPLLPFVQALPMPYMAVVYAVLWLGALGIMLGYKYRTSSAMFTVSFWYLLLIDKSYWNNHSYLFGLVALLLMFTRANCYWSFDAYLNPSERRSSVPYWNYFILKFQFFILYFMAGMKKGTAEWLSGYSVQKLSEHWVFEPFKLFMTVPQIDFIVVHWFIFVFDLTVAVWMMWSYTRHVAMIFCALFHLMNSRLFRIGMFPWVCLATMPLFYPFDWPKVVKSNIVSCFGKIKPIALNRLIVETEKTCESHTNVQNILEYDMKCTDEIVSAMKNDSKATQTNEESVKQGRLSHATEDKGDTAIDNDSTEIGLKRVIADNETVNKKQKITVYLIILYVLTQVFLPYSHFITKGYNNWTDGLYGYSWDMMVHSWDVSSVVVKVIDNDNKMQSYVDPYYYTLNDRWTRHGDMVLQYAHCLRDKLVEKSTNRKWNNPSKLDTRNISIHVDVWCSMNGRFTQRLFDPKVDLLKADWSPFSSVQYLMPLLDEALSWRKTLDDIREHVNSWGKNSDVFFLAELPNYYQEKYIPIELSNVTITVLKGLLSFEPAGTTDTLKMSYPLSSGKSIEVLPGFHKVLNIGDKPAYYMYTFFNNTLDNILNEDLPKPKLPIFVELNRRFQNMFILGRLLFDNIIQIFYCKSKCY